MAVVRHILRHPDTTALLANKTVPVALAGGVGFVPAEHSEILQTSYERTNAAGLLSVDLTPNSLVIGWNPTATPPTGTHYEATMPGASLPWSFVVPATTPPNVDNTDPDHPVRFWWLQDILTTTPPAPGVVVTGVQSVTAGANVTVDNTDPANPVVSAAAASGVTSVTAGDATVTIGGTGTAPTVKVTPATFDASGAAAGVLVTAEAYSDTKITAEVSRANAAYDATGAAGTAQAFAVQRANHTGTQSADTLTDGTTNKAFLATERTKLAGVATGATANSSDAVLEARANHTGTQLLATISDAGTAASHPATDFSGSAAGTAGKPLAATDTTTTNSRTPTAHAASHASGGTDPVTLAESQITGLVTDLASKQATGNYLTALTGDVTAAGPGSAAATVTKVNGTSLAGLATGLVKNTTSTGVPSIAVAADVPTVAAGSTGPLSASDATTTNSRTPTAHAASHAIAGADSVTPQSIGAGAYHWNTKIAVGESIIPRIELDANSGLTTGTLALTYFTAEVTETITQILASTATTAAAATPTLCRMGIYSIDNATLAGTLVASIVNDTALFAATTTAYTRTFSSSLSKVRGQRYAFGVLVVTGAAAPNLAGKFIPGSTTIANKAPRLCAQLAAQSDLPSSFTDASLSSANRNLIYAELLP